MPSKGKLIFLKKNLKILFTNIKIVYILLITRDINLSSTGSGTVIGPVPIMSRDPFQFFKII